MPTPRQSGDHARVTLRRRRWKHERQAVADESERERLTALFEGVRARTASLTMYMCWHGGRGHDYPDEVMQAAARLRRRHGDSGSDGDYTMLTLEPSDADWPDFLAVVAYCDWAYADDAAGHLLAESGSP